MTRKKKKNKSAKVEVNSDGNAGSYFKPVDGPPKEKKQKTKTEKESTVKSRETKASQKEIDAENAQ